MTRAAFAFIVAGFILGTVPTAHAAPIALPPAGFTADIGIVSDVSWRRCWRDRWGRRRCVTCRRDRWGRVRCG
jgi:hypothetical protein